MNLAGAKRRRTTGDGDLEVQCRKRLKSQDLEQTVQELEETVQANHQGTSNYDQVNQENGETVEDDEQTPRNVHKQAAQNVHQQTPQSNKKGQGKKSPNVDKDDLQVIMENLRPAIVDLEKFLLSSILVNPDLANIRKLRPRKTQPDDTFGALSQNLLGAAVKVPKAQQKKTSKEMPTMIPTNEHIAPLLDQIKPKLVSIINTARDIKHWIHLSTPRFETGGNFGASVLQSVLHFADEVEQTNRARLSKIPCYFVTRADLLQKVLDNPELTDAELAVQRFDDIQFDKWKFRVTEMRNDYERLLHYLSSNVDLLRQPRPDTDSITNCFF